ncbi:flagellar basal-body rod protein FlgF [Legionella jordanis]|uniref:Flagellar basal-body rod protein FlgF n=1 Tax=Legionella jordanis TaxID=456 RepID=A0A0W0V867_9GAMM|nr:flagellar basal-body rod protein FlgF [Legionella jordanis]KTD16271.1 flagellar basal body rod protein FlgF [Legionella jordanis]RMX04515.1 flagellar basal-body rod protein FlgF [Legionella jordanis]VEH12272.1 flagellar basal-body rod protein FlgF [Legionella jordanis]HAT8713482.1 flagellar basal-body rod protein FlgF [Legionella jordanis]
MEPVLYNAMHGSKTDFHKQTINTNNLANANTPGFKADIFQAQSMYVNGSVKTKEAYVSQQENSTDFTDGELITTGRDLDVAVQGDGWFAVQDSKGKEVYTRAGDFQLTENGMLVTAGKKPVLGDGGPISIPPAKRIEIGSDGTISIVPMEGDSNSLAVIDRLKLVKINPRDLTKNEEGLMTLKQGATAQTDASITVVKGALEGSNVNAVHQMVNLIATGREFDAQMKLMQIVDDNSDKLAQLLQE